jgi:hypothetical protein
MSYFLSDYANFAEKKPETTEEKKVGLLRRGAQLAVGKTPLGTLTRAAGLAGLGGSLYGVNRMRTSGATRNLSGARNAYRWNKLKSAMTGNTAKTIAGGAVASAGTTLALNEGRKMYEQRNRKWWEVL